MSWPNPDHVASAQLRTEARCCWRILGHSGGLHRRSVHRPLRTRRIGIHSWLSFGKASQWFPHSKAISLTIRNRKTVIGHSKCTPSSRAPTFRQPLTSIPTSRVRAKEANDGNEAETVDEPIPRDSLHRRAHGPSVGHETSKGKQQRRRPQPTAMPTSATPGSKLGRPGRASQAQSVAWEPRLAAPVWPMLEG